ncbi:MAG: hypothetical protein ACYC92_08715 [Candidatus Acidiferrales bacterium]
MAIESSIRAEVVPPKRLWFGLATGAAAWLLLGFFDLVIVWEVCGYATEYGVDNAHEYARVLAFVIAVVLFVIAVIAGITSYRNWRVLSRQKHLLDANATDRREFMALVGVIISITLGLGIVWLSLPPLIIQLCLRAK